MVNEVRTSDLVDPLQKYSVFSLVHGTFRDSTHAPNLNDPNDLESLHNFLKAKALRSPNKLLDQAKIIVDGGLELMNSKFPSHVAFEDKNEFVAAQGKENPQARRPALGRKRPQFSFKPISSQPAVSLEPSLDIDQLSDPVEFFLAHERRENAKKEYQRQRGGVLMDLNQNNPSTTARHRRPGLLGRTVTYKHHNYSSMLSNNNKTFMSSQETIEEDLLSPSNSSQREITDPNDASQERELAGSIAKTENKVNELFDELLSLNCEDLDGDVALNLLEERLQIKPIDLDKLCLPDLHDIQRIDFKDSGGNLPKPRNSSLDIHNMLKGISSKTPVKHRQEAEIVHHLASPTPRKSPFASMSLLKRHILQSNPSHDPFSALNIDLSPARNSSPVERIDKQSDQVDKGKELSFSGKLKSLILDEDDNAVANTGSSEVVTEDSTRPFDKSVNDNLSRLGVGIDVRSSGSHGDLEDNIGGSNMDDRVIDADSSRPDAGTDAWINGANELDDKGEDVVQEAVASAQPDLNIEDSTMEKLNSSLSKLDQSSSVAVEHHAMDGSSKTPDVGSEQHIEKIQEPSRIILNEQSKEKTPPRQELNPPRKERKRKECSQRQSLAGAGTLWESGIRRSTRIKIRPLEYWKGERFLYGRIHESLATVIGLKYASPEKGDGNPTVKVKSYVTDEYKELVELAALH